MPLTTRSKKICSIREICGRTELEKLENKKLKGEMMKKRIIEIAVKVIVAALTAFLTAITTTSCMGHGPF